MRLAMSSRSFSPRRSRTGAGVRLNTMGTGSPGVSGRGDCVSMAISQWVLRPGSSRRRAALIVPMDRR